MRSGRNGILVSVSEASKLFGVLPGTLRRWASEDQWDRFGGPRSRHWRIEQVQAGHNKRRGDRAA